MRSVLWVWKMISTIKENALFENKLIRNICIYVEKMLHKAKKKLHKMEFITWILQILLG
jgi:hypothetical protein